jgi:hypothetical protein
MLEGILLHNWQMSAKWNKLVDTISTGIWTDGCTIIEVIEFKKVPIEWNEEIFDIILLKVSDNGEIKDFYLTFFIYFTDWDLFNKKVASDNSMDEINSFFERFKYFAKIS